MDVCGAVYTVSSGLSSEWLTLFDSWVWFTLWPEHFSYHVYHLAAEAPSLPSFDVAVTNCCQGVRKGPNLCPGWECVKCINNQLCLVVVPELICRILFLHNNACIISIMPVQKTWLLLLFFYHGSSIQHILCPGLYREGIIYIEVCFFMQVWLYYNYCWFRRRFSSWLLMLQSCVHGKVHIKYSQKWKP